ncbi:PilT/PilU family type 4a pilus ATPase [Pseudomonas sp. ZM23]|uniref:PilT/PilU family type 4a pilus ATPase n=1 Tax=Pseudomonas triclosanedens TaxID=2961893 RepID=A0ABY7A323_9PSED|nr:PilT/PilU family type 4a pilus ATPase [Pseudomonas triclosanedens]MCP8464928.1 PilT/PilU family type 4a pilus ATPase [Pseudomonas triclosanedens]MCP8470360.1 PilT/PilU family type 4a pilus ATPase [Pseudomonas triclosanedens]MCP8476165.1 PilT/PilU family type 4a pilus ATPase [Pseudomonas triclosanedens]WAI51602.1 PilT/PilU family type 4a pilus ATPase [Pseudomonas triclosanedens]
MSDTPLPDVLTYLSHLPQQAGSDMFFSVGAPPHLKVEGHSRPVGERVLGNGEVKTLAWQLMTPEQAGEFERDLEMNLAVSVPDVGRFRANIYYQRGEVAMVVRLIKQVIPDVTALGLPPILDKLAMQDRGLILVIGAAGSGKSTTLASMLDFRNRHRSGHIVCIEDPIEFLHAHHKSIIDQREVGLDTRSFEDALRNVLREAPDVIMLGEIRDAATMQHALHYAETGHLCVATLHGTSCRHAIERIARFFPDEARAQVLADLSQNLLALVGQRLVPGVRQRRVVAVELVLGTPHIRGLIQRDELPELKGAVERALESGMQSFDQSLYRLLEEGRITLADALKFADSRTDLALKVKLERGMDDDGGGSLFGA